MSERRSTPARGGIAPKQDVRIEAPDLADGGELWRIARDSKTLDLNSPYAYLLWCRDFRDTSRIARVDGNAAGFVTGYIRPAVPDTIVVWQVAVDASHRGAGLAARLLDDLLSGAVERGARYLETTITADNQPSIRTFSALARRWQTDLHTSDLFPADVFPEDGHEAEFLYRIGPVPTH